MSDSTGQQVDQAEQRVHSTPAIEALPAFEDNYIWLVHAGGNAVVIDPGQAAPVRARLAAAGLRLRAILLTHHHNDHVGGVAELVAETGARVYGPATETLPHCDVPLRGGDQVTLAEVGLDLRVIDVPGHTAGHIAYAGYAHSKPVVFCGDTLFSGGCGRLFEGTPAQMHASLASLAALPPATLVYAAHEYTLSNLRWARAVDPDNLALAGWQKAAETLRARGQPTLPAALGVELAINPFLRTHIAGIQAAASSHAGHPLQDEIAVFAALREWKNSFR
ncbi:hydroxyacylglutathione hydrolase [Pigmentiphaga aceris]|uniref:Hydroxyacylglutathione hydrolase n=1 Tax=Pigmentiphaga aceris TaxID=1940612 RepID=A0A5C0AVD6_9BURK|nr:hydroxyacylglutathione hydrolase [Pigmentiphaga aceris]QEI05313.1 hydroxyacylglutathione hydrolase [Pigmentiphaga aceris]